MAPTTRSVARSAPKSPTNVEASAGHDVSVQPVAVVSVAEAAVRERVQRAVLRFLWLLKLFDALVGAVLLEAISSQTIQRELNPGLTYTQIQVRLRAQPQGGHTMLALACRSLLVWLAPETARAPIDPDGGANPSHARSRR